MGGLNKLAGSGMLGVLPMMLNKEKPDTWSSPRGLMNMMKDNNSPRPNATGLMDKNKPDMMGFPDEKKKKPMGYL